MAHDIEHLKREIDALEKQISSHPFEGLFDRKRLDQLQDKLRKKRKELARLEAGDEHEETVPGLDHIEVPEFIAGIEETPDLGPDFPIGIEHDEMPRKTVPTRPSSAAKPVLKPAAKPVAKAVKKATPKSKPAAKPKAKPKPTAKPTAKKKTAAKPAKKKSKR